MLDGVAKSPTSGVAAIFQDLDILIVCLRPGKITTPCWSKFLISHHILYCEIINV
ncbi:MAG: hypothetical protein GQ563_03610 [Desulfuromusa sp.]|nr:hypothetical protein [Desulfuromusa sp.]